MHLADRFTRSDTDLSAYAGSGVVAPAFVGVTKNSVFPDYKSLADASTTRPRAQRRRNRNASGI